MTLPLLDIRVPAEGVCSKVSWHQIIFRGLMQDKERIQGMPTFPSSHFHNTQQLAKLTPVHQALQECLMDIILGQKHMGEEVPTV